MTTFLRRLARTLGVVLALGLLVLGPPALFLGWQLAWDPAAPPAARPGHARDVSRLEEVEVAGVIPLAATPEAAEAQLRELLVRARAEGRKVSVAGARHSMGGHTYFPGGLVVSTLPLDGMSLDPGARLLTVGAGATWEQVVRFLHPHGLSVEIMQSFASFTVGGSLSVNCHGMQPGRPPVAASVESLRLLGPDGVVRRCSRAENRELFRHALGGYGLFGVILDAVLRVVPDEAYEVERVVLPTPELLERLRELHADPEVGLIYSRLSVSPGNFLGEGLVQAFRRVGPPRPGPLLEPSALGLKRSLYLATLGSGTGKRLRWLVERRLGEQLGATSFRRNDSLLDDVATYANHQAETTDVLLEFFVPPARFGAFTTKAGEVLRARGADLLNWTIRDVRADIDTALPYAREDVWAAVLFLNVPASPAGDADLGELTRELVEVALAHGGTYYLPYRRHHTREQLRRAYPGAAAFFRFKREVDPEELFSNLFYETYGRGEG